MTARLRNHTSHATAGKLSYSEYEALAQRLALRQNLQIIPANESASMAGTGLFQGRMLRRRISFTPYVHNQCSADCVFCSERLVRKKSMPKSMSLSSAYGEKLRKILQDLGSVSIFLSISGMEPLESLDFVEKNLAAFAEFEEKGGTVPEKVIYTNLSKAVSDPERVLQVLHTYPVSRVESSRHHFDTRINNSIMRFKVGYSVQDTRQYEHSIRLLQKHIPVKLACVLQKKRHIHI